MSHQDLKPIVLHGKTPGVIRGLNTKSSTSTVKKEHFTNVQNSSSIESRIDDGKITTPKKIPRDVSELIKVARTKDESVKTQTLLAKKCNLPIKDISDMENGTMDLTHPNKLKIRTVQRILQLQKFLL